MSRRAGRTLACGLTVAVGAAMPAWAHGTTERVSVGPRGVQANGISEYPVLSAGGRFVAFHSFATNLVSANTNDAPDVFVHDLLTGLTQRVSVGIHGVQGNGSSERPTISADGRYVAFESSASNLVAGDTNDWTDVFVHDRQLGTTRRMSMGAGGIQSDGSSGQSVLTADGTLIVFASDARNLVRDDTNDFIDVFGRRYSSVGTWRVSVGSHGIQGNGFSEFPAVSADGRFVTFYSWATNFVRRDTNDGPDVFVRDRQTHTTRLVSVTPGGTVGNGQSYYPPAISADGHFMAFSSDASDLVHDDGNGRTDVFVRDLQAGATRRVSLGPEGVQGDDDSGSDTTAISATGRFVTYLSRATNLVAGDTNGTVDAFVRDLLTGKTRRVSVSSAGAQGNGPTIRASISADGRVVAFQSYASNVVPGDTNGEYDIFVRRLAP